MKRETLLELDGVINLLLGILLLIYPEPLVQLLGIPNTNTVFYPNILGGVLFGIGVALFLERYKSRFRVVGLGMGGAVVINLCGSLVVAGWLLFGALSLPSHTVVILWLLVAFLVGLSLVELISQFSQPNTEKPHNKFLNVVFLQLTYLQIVRF